MDSAGWAAVLLPSLLAALALLLVLAGFALGFHRLTRALALLALALWAAVSCFPLFFNRMFVQEIAAGALKG